MPPVLHLAPAALLRWHCWAGRIALAGVDLTYEDFSATVRDGRGRMPAYPADSVSDQALQDVYAWLRSLQ